MKKVSLSKYTEENFEAIGSLYGPVQPVFRELLYRLAMAGIYIRITSASRSTAEQEVLYGQGRPWLATGTIGRIVTWVRGNYSMHTWNLAIDIAPLKRIGPIYYRTWYAREALDQIAMIAADIGISQPYPINDGGHFEYNQGLENGVMSMIESGYPNIIPPVFQIAERPGALNNALTRMKHRGIIPKNA